MRVNMVNVCTPVDADRDEIAAALTRIPVKPTFNPDYEVARGHTTDKAGASDWVRMRPPLGPLVERVVQLVREHPGGVSAAAGPCRRRVPRGRPRSRRGRANRRPPRVVARRDRAAERFSDLCDAAVRHRQGPVSTIAATGVSA
jgi:hypothetical protein